MVVGVESILGQFCCCFVVIISMVVGVESNLCQFFLLFCSYPRFDSTPTTIEIITTKQQQN
jgi:hypothetical protein